MTREELFENLVNESDAFWLKMYETKMSIDDEVDLETEFLNFLKSFKLMSEKEYQMTAKVYIKKYGD